MTMKEILEENLDIIQQAGKALVEIGLELAEGRVNDVMERFILDRQKYEEWRELDKALIDIETAMGDRKNTLAVQQILLDLVGTVLGSAILKGM